MNSMKVVILQLNIICHWNIRKVVSAKTLFITLTLVQVDLCVSGLSTNLNCIELKTNEIVRYSLRARIRNVTWIAAVRKIGNKKRQDLF